MLVCHADGQGSIPGHWRILFFNQIKREIAFLSIRIVIVVVRSPEELLKFF